jgi:hypothetical protein
MTWIGLVLSGAIIAALRLSWEDLIHGEVTTFLFCLAVSFVIAALTVFFSPSLLSQGASAQTIEMVKARAQ